MEAVKKRFTSGSHSSPTKDDLRSSTPAPDDDLQNLSPELVPIVTLLSSQSHRRYYEGIFMLYYDLNGDGKPADREWKEVYGILTGNQLAYWDAANLAEFRNNPTVLLENSSKPNYINFTDSVYNAMKVLPAAKQNLDNVIIVSTTLKNRYIIQLKSINDLNNWYLALRLSNYEYQSLQQAYTGALLSARGSRLSDIRTILAEKRFDHEDWISIRYGSGMAWKRCYAVVEPSTSKKSKFTPGRILLFENDQKKKKQLMAVVTNASAVSAVYPQSHLLIDHSTMLKLEGYINFKSPSLSTKVSKKSIEDFKNTSIFLMPEQHSSVPGFDTLIRFLVPLLDSFGLYGRPKKLRAERQDPDSLLFGLPTLPHVHYLELDDLQSFTTRPDFLNWDVKTWSDNMKGVLKSKIDRGYEGCGSARGFQGAISSLTSPNTPSSSSFRNPSGGSPDKLRNKPQPANPKDHAQNNNPYNKMQQISNTSQTKIPPPGPGAGPGPGHGHGPGPGIAAGAAVGAAAGAAAMGYRNASNGSVVHNPNAKNVNNLTIEPGHSDNHRSMELSDIYQKYSDIKSPSDQFNNSRNDLLNGSSEEIDEDELPDNVRKINLSENIYPTNDNDLFSDDDDEEDDILSSGSDRIDSRKIGLLSNGSTSNPGLTVPPYNNRNSSYSSVQSPMTQYQEFNEKFSNTVASPPVKGNAGGYGHSQNFRNLSDSGSDSESSPPIPPPHTHSQQQRSNLSPSASAHSFYEASNNSNSRIHKPKYITSPNNSQNQVPTFKHDDVDAPLTGFQQVPGPKPNSPHLQSAQFAPSQPKQRPTHSEGPPVPHGNPSHGQVPPLSQNAYHSNPQAPKFGYQTNPQQMQQMQQMQQKPPQQMSRQMPPQGQGQPPMHHQPQRRAPPAQYGGVPPSVNSGIPPSASYNNVQGQYRNQPMAHPQQQNPRQYQQAPQSSNNLRNYGNTGQYQQYQYQPQGYQQVPPGQGQPRPQGQRPHPQHPQQQNPNGYTRQY